MPELVPFRTTDPDHLFTLTINLMWQLLYSAEEQDAAWASQDLLVAIDALDCGPWRHLGPTPDLLGVPFIIMCTLLDRMLTVLGRVTPGFGARVALDRARAWLDPAHGTER